MEMRLLMQGRVVEGEAARGWVEQRQDNTLFWLDITEPTAGEIAWLGQQFGFHPLALEDLAGENQRPKLDEYDDYIFIVTRELRVDGSEGEGNRDAVRVPCVEASEVHFFLAPTYLVTVHDRKCTTVGRTFAQAMQRNDGIGSSNVSKAMLNLPLTSNGNGKRGKGNGNDDGERDLPTTRHGSFKDTLVAAHQLKPTMQPPPKAEEPSLAVATRPGSPKVGNVPTTVRVKPRNAETDGHSRSENLLTNLSVGEAAFGRGLDFVLYSILDDVADSYFSALDGLEVAIDEMEDRVIERPTRAILDGIFTLKNSLMAMRKLTNPMRELLNMIITHEYPAIRRENLIYFRDVHSLMVSVYEMVDTERDAASNVMSAYLSSVSNDLNTVMKRLTLITVLAMPITAITGFAGMNMSSLPNDAFWYSALIFASLIIIPAMLFMYLRGRGWV